MVAPIATPVAATPITGIVPAIVVPRRTPPPTESPAGAIWIIPTPIPPQAVRVSGKNVCIQSVIIYIPIPWRQTVNHIPIERTAYRNGVTGIAETDDTHRVFIIVLRALKTINPFPSLIQRFLLNIQGIILHREVIISWSITTIILIHIAHFSFHILHHHCRTGGCVNGSRVLLLRNHHFHLLLNLLFLFSFFLRDEIKVVINALWHCPIRQAHHHKRS